MSANEKKLEVLKKLIILLRDEDTDLLDDTTVGPNMTAYDLFENAIGYHSDLNGTPLGEGEGEYDEYAANL